MSKLFTAAAPYHRNINSWSKSAMLKEKNCVWLWRIFLILILKREKIVAVLSYQLFKSNLRHIMYHHEQSADTISSRGRRETRPSKATHKTQKKMPQPPRTHLISLQETVSLHLPRWWNINHDFAFMFLLNVAGFMISSLFLSFFSFRMIKMVMSTVGSAWDIIWTIWTRGKVSTHKIFMPFLPPWAIFPGILAQVVLIKFLMLELCEFLFLLLVGRTSKIRSWGAREKKCVCHVVHHFKFRPDDAMRIRNEPLHSSPSTWRHQRKMMLEKFSEKWKVKEGSREMKNRVRNVFNLLKFFSTKIAYLSSHSRKFSPVSMQPI